MEVSCDMSVFPALSPQLQPPSRSTLHTTWVPSSASTSTLHINNGTHHPLHPPRHTSTYSSPSQCPPPTTTSPFLHHASLSSHAQLIIFPTTTTLPQYQVSHAHALRHRPNQRFLAHLGHLLPTPQRTHHLPQWRSRRNHLRVHCSPTPLPRSR